jgi:beta-catenin-like protein 1
VPTAKRRKLNASQMDELLNSASQVEELSGSAVRALCSALDKCIDANMELRVRHASEPAKFMKSEAALHAAIGELTRVAENPDFYATLRAANAPESLLALFSHENVDVTMEVVKLLSELIDGDVIAGHEGALQFTRGLLVAPHNLISLLVAFLPRLQESQDVGGEYEEDSKAVYHVLEMFENLADLFPELCAQACEQTGVLEWLTHRACASAFDGNAMYASEILSIFLQPIPSYKGTPATAWMGQGARIRTLIHRVAGYRKRDPESGEEKEYVANLFMSLCSTLLDQKTNQDVFSAEKGVDLMLVLMRKRVYARVAAFKVLDYATQNNTANCESFVDMGYSSETAEWASRVCCSGSPTTPIPSPTSAPSAWTSRSARLTWTARRSNFRYGTQVRERELRGGGIVCVVCEVCGEGGCRHRVLCVVVTTYVCM